MSEVELVREQLIDCACECAELVKNFICAAQMLESGSDFTVNDFSVLEERINQINLYYDNAIAWVRVKK